MILRLVGWWWGEGLCSESNQQILPGNLGQRAAITHRLHVKTAQVVIQPGGEM